MLEPSDVVASTLASYYEEVRDNIHELVAPISSEELWTKPYPYGNSIGHLLLHLTGNLNNYIGARIAGTGYVRNRPLEFNDTSSARRNKFSPTSMLQSRWSPQRFATSPPGIGSRRTFRPYRTPH